MRTILIAAALFAPGTAWAASGDIGCIEGKLGATAMQRIGDGVVAAADKGGNPASALDADREALIAARAACRTAGNWSPTAIQIAVSYTQARATRLGAEAALRKDGLDATKFAAAYAALPVPDRKSLIEKASSGALAAVTSTSAQPRVRRHVLLYFSALAAIEFYPAEFAAA
ncbi:hypothetical protein [Sphingomonas sp.]|uniref:hypothetical protein n=1 Tax=Sphingomonas sp. TaxID=28214 RepID=UPI002583DCFC|nr:hypothetical protein [Sphingomonas sp.]